MYTENYNQKENYFKSRKEITLNEITRMYGNLAFAKIDILLDVSLLENERIIDNIEKNWDMLFENKIDRRLIEDYIAIMKLSYLKFKKNEITQLKQLEFIFVDICLKEAILKCDNAYELTEDKILSYTNNLILYPDNYKNYLSKVKKMYDLNSARSDENLKGIKKYFKNFQKQLESAKELISEKIKEFKANYKKCYESPQPSNDEVLYLKEKITELEKSNDILKTVINQLENRLKNQEENIYSDILNILNHSTYGNILDRLYIWAFKEKEYDIDDIKLYTKNLFRALEALDIVVSDEHLFSEVILKPEDIGINYRLNKDIGEYSPSCKKIVFPGWKYKDKIIINPMIEI